MNNNMPSNNENVEEVPLDLFNQVSLDDYTPVETLDLAPKTEVKEDSETSSTPISIPADAYAAAIAAMNNSNGPQN